MKKAIYFKKLGNKKVQCELCPKNCIILEGKTGFCSARKNIKGDLYSLVYGNPISIHIDPIEKKPLYHFLLGTDVLSFGTIGCNLNCKFCQNFDISRAKFEDFNYEKITPQQIVELAMKNKCKSIAYTYNEPTVFYEFALETAKIARKKGIKNVIVSNGFINKEPLQKLAEYIDAANIDLKSFSEDFYKSLCSASLKNVLGSIKILKNAGAHIELTTLVIPGKNDSVTEIEKIAKWIKENIGQETVYHLSRFFPMHKMQDVEVTPVETLKKLEKIAKKYLKFVYLGNIPKY